MIETITLIYLILIFLTIYMFLFFVMMNIKNRKKLFYYPEPKKDYYVSILVPAWNEEDTMEATLEHLANLNYSKKKLDIIAINDGSTDNTVQVIKKMIKKYPFIRILDKPNSGKADSLNQGIKMAKGELVAVVDADSFPTPDSLRKITGFFNEEKMSAVTSFVRVRNKNKNFLTRIQSMEYLTIGWIRKLLDFVDSVYVTNGPLSVYRKKYLINVGGFDPKTVTEDIDVTWNLLKHGYKTGMSLDADVSTEAPHKLSVWHNQRARWGQGGFQALHKYRKTFLKKGIFGLFIIPFVMVSIALGIFAFLFSSFLMVKSLINWFTVTFASVDAGALPFHFNEFNFFPSITFLFIVLLFGGSWIYYNYILNVSKYDEKIGVKRFFNLIIYLVVYLWLYSIVWFTAFYRFVRRKHKW